MWRQLINLSSLVLTPKNPLVVPTISKIAGFLLQRNFSMLSPGNGLVNRSIELGEPRTKGFLEPTNVALSFDRGFKVKGRLRRRCKDCYFVVRQERLYVICKTHPRHKQMSMIKKPKNTWILTDATQSKIRPF